MGGHNMNRCVIMNPPFLLFLQRPISNFELCKYEIAHHSSRKTFWGLIYIFVLCFCYTAVKWAFTIIMNLLDVP